MTLYRKKKTVYLFAVVFLLERKLRLAINQKNEVFKAAFVIVSMCIHNVTSSKEVSRVLLVINSFSFLVGLSVVFSSGNQDINSTKNWSPSKLKLLVVWDDRMTTHFRHCIL